jgi:hypothetical protein
VRHPALAMSHRYNIAPGLASTHRRQYVLCTTPLHAGCDKDEDFSTHYGQPVYVCKI